MSTAIKAYALRILAFGPLAVTLRRPLLLGIRVAEKVRNRLESVHRNLPQVRRMALASRETRLQIATKYFEDLAGMVQGMPYQPKLSVLVPIYKVEPNYLREALTSVTQQVYRNWELCLVDDASGDPRLSAIMAEFARAYPGQVKTGVNQTNSHISVTSNECLKLATGDYVVLLDHDDRLYPHSLAEVVRYINLHERPDILYSDERTIDASGQRFSIVYNKPDWAPFMHLTMNYTTHLTVYSRKLVNEVGGFRKGFEGSQDHDLMMRMCEKTTKPVVHIPFCLYQWRAHVASTANASGAKPYAATAGEKAVGEAIARRGRPGTVQFNTKTLQYNITFDLKIRPLISIIIPSKDSPQLIQRCLDSVIAKTTYENYEVVVSDNGTTNQQTLQLYAEYTKRLPGRFKVVTKERPFNFGAQINDGVKGARGEYVLLLNNDTEVIDPEWLTEMLRLAQFPEVGAVGCKLLFGDRSIQHAGVVLSPGKIAEHVGLLAPEDDNVYWNVLNTIHETMAVTAACMLVDKAKFNEVGGMDEHYLPRAYGDVEFCLALRDKGYTSLYTPAARLFHHESSSRGRAIEYFERFYLQHRRGKELTADPYLNLNFERSARFALDRFYADLDLDGREFAFLLNTPMSDWRRGADRGLL